MFEDGLVNHQNWSHSGKRYSRDETAGEKKSLCLLKVKDLTIFFFPSGRQMLHLC